MTSYYPIQKTLSGYLESIPEDDVLIFHDVSHYVSSHLETIAEEPVEETVEQSVEETPEQINIEQWITQHNNLLRLYNCDQQMNQLHPIMQLLTNHDDVEIIRRRLHEYFQHYFD